MLKWPDKDPDERLDYMMNWAREMQARNDSIIKSEWFIVDDDGSLTIESDGLSGHKSYVWLTGGDHGRGYQLTNRVHTSGGRIFDRSVLLLVVEK